MEFEWDLRKEAENSKKHHASFLEAVETFSDPSGFALRDNKHYNKGGTVLLDWQNRQRPDLDNKIYEARQQDSINRFGRMARVQEFVS